MIICRDSDYKERTSTNSTPQGRDELLLHSWHKFAESTLVFDICKSGVSNSWWKDVWSLTTRFIWRNRIVEFCCLLVAIRAQGSSSATELGVWFYIVNGGFNHCATSKLIQIVKKLFVLHLHFDCKPTAGSTNLDTKSLSILRACFVSMSDQWNGDAPCKSLCLLWTENADSLNDGNKTEHQLGWFTQIRGNFSRSKSCKNKQFQQKMMLSAV